MRGRRHGQRRDHRAPRLVGSPDRSLDSSPVTRHPLDLSFIFKLALAIGAMLTVYFIAASVTRGFGQAPDESEPAEIQAVEVRFECIVCGTQVTMTAAPDAEPVAPRHCMEEMHLVAPYE